MHIILQIGVFFLLCLAGDFLSALLPIPGSILAMLLLFLCLLLRVIRPEHIDQKSDFLLSNMAFFFIPAGVGILEQFPLLLQNLGPLAVICVVTTVLTFAASSGTVRLVLWLQEKKGGSGRE